VSQAAIVLAARAAVGGEAYRLDEPSALDLPEDLGRIGRQRKLRVEQAAGPLDIDLSTHLDHPELQLPPSTSVEITRRLIDRPQAVTAAASSKPTSMATAPRSPAPWSPWWRAADSVRDPVG
jgi:hypothetical protein